MSAIGTHLDRSPALTASASVDQTIVLTRRSGQLVERLARNWVYGGSLAGLLLIALTPVLSQNWSPVLTLIFLHLPMYMLHQLEEHDGDRFRRFFNDVMGHGKPVLSPLAAFVINVPVVWGLTGGSFMLAATHHLGWGLIGVYLVLVNAVMHLVQGLALRRYNPGMTSAWVVFLPLGAFTLASLHRAGAATPAFHAIGLVVAVLAHVLIVAHVKRRLRQLS